MNNDELLDLVMNHLMHNERKEVLDVFRSLTNPLQAAWLGQAVLDECGPSMMQTRNWLVNAFYNGV